MTNGSDKDAASMMLTFKDISSLADEIDEVRRLNLRNLSVAQITQLNNVSATLRSSSIALGANVSRIVLAGVNEQIKNLSDAIEEADAFLDDIANLSKALQAIDKVIGFAVNILALAWP